MKQMNTITKLYIALSLLAMIVAGSCRKVMEGVEDDSMNRAFTPSGLSVRTVKDSAIFKWTAPVYATGKAYKYTLELSTDSLFGKVDYSTITDTTGALILDPAISLNTPYFYRVRANEYKGAAPSNYYHATNSFRLIGQQYFKVLRDFEVSANSVLLHWYVTPETQALTKIKITTTDGTVTEFQVTSAEIAAGEKKIEGLTAETKYTLQLLADAKSKGFINFTTSALVTYTTILSPSDNLTNAITAAVKGDVIGLNPGDYALTGVINIENKHLTLRSVSNNPADTRIKVRELNLVGDSAGLTLAGLDLNGNYSGTSYGVTLVQFKGSTATTGTPAFFKNLKLDNCVIHDFSRCFIRGNYGTAAKDHKIGAITVNNCILYNIDATNSQGYYMFSMEKMLIGALSIAKTTGYAIGSGLINMSTAFTSDTIPAISLDYCTFNNFCGGSGKYAFIDAAANKIKFTFTNSIVANTPISGSVNAAAFRGTGSGNVMTFTNNNYFNLLNTAGGATLTLTGLSQSGNQTLDLGWTAATTNFKLSVTDQNATIFTGSTSGSTLGDPRWAY